MTRALARGRLAPFRDIISAGGSKKRGPMKRRATVGGHIAGDTDVTISVTIVKGTGLAAKQQTSSLSAKPVTSSPYALLRCGNVEQRTKTVKKSLNPAWNESFEFKSVSEQHAILRIALYDADPLTQDHFLGECIIPVSSLSADDEKATWRELEVRPGSTEFVRGELCVTIKVVEREGSGAAGAGAAQPSLKKAKQQHQSVMDRQVFGQTAYSKHFVIRPDEIDFSQGKVLGEGGFGTVRLGTFRGLPVAVKTLIMREDVKKAELVDEFRQEVSMLAKVSHHPKLCLFLGASVVEPLTLVSELMAGSVRNILDKPRDESAVLLPWARRVEMLLDAALGMAFLHGMTVVHRDMKADNLLLDEHGTVKVADFGLSKTLAISTTSDDVGTPGFKAPEIYDHEGVVLKAKAKANAKGKAKAAAPSSSDVAAAGYSLPVDVFAFGATIYELLSFTGKNWGWPYGWALDLATDEQVEAAVLAGKLPSALGGSPVPAECPKALKGLYEACMRYEPDERPSFDGIVPSLRDLLKEMRAAP